MNRRHRAEDYVDLVARVRKARADLALSSDFIVGFPGESARDFDSTLELVREFGFAQAYLVQVFGLAPAPPPPAWTGRSRRS